MSENVREQHTILDAVSIEAWRTERYRRKQNKGRSNGSGEGTADGAHPLEFDEGGFPVFSAQRQLRRAGGSTAERAIGIASAAKPPTHVNRGG